MVRNHSCCTATANCLFAPYLSIYSLVALVSLYRPECNHLSVEYAFPIVTNQNLTHCISESEVIRQFTTICQIYTLGRFRGESTKTKPRKISHYWDTIPKNNA